MAKTPARELKTERISIRFGDRRVTFRLSEQAATDLRHLAKRAGITVSEAVRRAADQMTAR